MKPPLIRRAEERDHAQISSLCRAIDPNDYVPNAWATWMEAGKGINLVAQSGDRVCGCAYGEIHEFPDAWSQAVRVHPEVQRMGVGLRLMAALEKELVSRGAHAIFGNIGAFNERSMAFFAGQNWKTVRHVRRRLAGCWDGTPLHRAPLDRLKLIRLLQEMPSPASIEKMAYYKRAYFSMNESNIDKAISGRTVRMSPGGDAYAFLDSNESNAENRIWIVALAGSSHGIRSLLEEFLDDARSRGARLIVDSDDSHEAQSIMDDMGFRPPGKSDMYVVVKKDLIPR
ncbi:MAG: GNAT family N-acetyltransferase [Acidobacteria bacterium]|nr:GNAT family N-acetyltransferase [Acidobacteriota bacterium]